MLVYGGDLSLFSIAERDKDGREKKMSERERDVLVCSAV
jgi:hypothetical protein